WPICPRGRRWKGLRGDQPRRACRRPRPPRAARREPQLTARPGDPGDVPVHRLGGDALRRILHGLLLRARRQPARAGGVAAAAVRVPRLRGGREHGHPRHLELHDPLGDPVDQAERPERPAGGARLHDPAGNGLPRDPAGRVRARRLQHERRRVRVGLLRADGAPRRARGRRALAAHDLRRALLQGPFLGGAPSRRRDPRDLLALRRRDVDHRVLRRVRAVGGFACDGNPPERFVPYDTQKERPTMKNPLRDEASAFQVVLLTLGGAVLVVLAAWINTWLGLAVFIVLVCAALWAIRGGLIQRP